MCIAGGAIRLPTGLRDARFVERINRFTALIECDGDRALAHVANSGRLSELLHPDNGMLVAPAPAASGRKTAYDLVLVEVDGVLVSLNARLPGALFQQAVEAGVLAEFGGYSRVEREVVYGESRLDLLLTGPQGSCYVETKSVTLVQDGVALFPDAPTARGSKHLRSLTAARREGTRAAIAFIIQRPDATAFATHAEADPEFSQTLAVAVAHGVEAYAYRCRVDRREIAIAGSVPVITRGMSR